VKTGGRKKGSRNKATVKKTREIAASGETPLDYMLALMRDPRQAQEVRLDAAKSAAPYVHAKLAAIEHTGKDGGAIEIVEIPEQERARRIAFVLSKATRETVQ
jgi:hypothetical protein